MRNYCNNILVFGGQKPKDDQRMQCVKYKNNDFLNRKNTITAHVNVIHHLKNWTQNQCTNDGRSRIVMHM